jgi:hypothetical protein
MGSSAQIPTSQPYAWPHDSSFLKSTTALVIIDMQRDCMLKIRVQSNSYALFTNYAVTQPQSFTWTDTSPSAATTSALPAQSYRMYNCC